MQKNTLPNHAVHDRNHKRSIVNNGIDKKSIHPQAACEHSHDDRKKRTGFGQFFQILEYLLTSDDTKISSISRCNNMSHDTATRNCEKLVSMGLVTTEIMYDTKIYRLTSDGRSFIADCQHFRNILCGYNMCHMLYH